MCDDRVWSEVIVSSNGDRLQLAGQSGTREVTLVVQLAVAPTSSSSASTFGREQVGALIEALEAMQHEAFGEPACARDLA